MMGRLSFLLLVIYSLPVGMHHLFMDPQHGTGFKFLQMMLTALVTVPTLLTIFTISASMETGGCAAAAACSAGSRLCRGTGRWCSRVGPFAALCRALGIPGYGRISPPPTGPVSAPASQVAWTAKTRDLLASANVGLGAALAKDVCSACHGLDGKSVDPTQFPNLAGQTKEAIYKQLRDFQVGDRQSDVMGPVAQQLNEQQIADAAAYYAGQKPADLMAASSGVDLEIVTLARIGDPRRGIPSCDSCHGQSRSGPEGAPLLLGQTPAYMERQLKNFAARERHNDLYERMRVNAHRLTPQEIHSLPIYYSGMPASH